MMMITFRIDLTSGEITVETEGFDKQGSAAVQAAFTKSLLGPNATRVRMANRAESRPDS